MVMRLIGGLKNQDCIEDGHWQLLPFCREGVLERAGHTETVVGKHIIVVAGRNGCVFRRVV